MQLGQNSMNKSYRHRLISDALYIFEAETETQVRKRLRDFPPMAGWSKKEPRAVKNFIQRFECTA